MRTSDKNSTRAKSVEKHGNAKNDLPEEHELFQSIDDLKEEEKKTDFDSKYSRPGQCQKGKHHLLIS